MIDNYSTPYGVVYRVTRTVFAVRYQATGFSEDAATIAIAAMIKSGNPHIVQNALATLAAAWRAAARQITGEPALDELKLAQWADKYAIATAWDNAARPDVNTDPTTYGYAIAEAAHRTDDLADPNALILAWLTNGQQWLDVQNWYAYQFEPQKRAWIRTHATLDELNALTVDGLTAEIRAAIPQ